MVERVGVVGLRIPTVSPKAVKDFMLSCVNNGTVTHLKRREAVDLGCMAGW